MRDPETFIPSYNPSSLPPREAWKEPSKWLGFVHPDDRIELPTDDRDFVQVDNAFDRVMDLFRDTYKWEFNPNDFRTIPDLHHYYYYSSEWQKWSAELEASEDPLEHENAKNVIDFRSNATNIGLMLRGIHNTLHHVTKKPQKPALEHITEYMTHYKLAHQAFSKITTAAEKVLESNDIIAMRESTITTNPDLIGGEGVVDTVGQEILGDKLNRRYSYLHQSLLEFTKRQRNGMIMPDGEKIHIDTSTPLETIVALGKRARKFIAIDHRPR